MTQLKSALLTLFITAVFFTLVYTASLWVQENLNRGLVIEKSLTQP